jgi:hypothetical protein
MQAEAVAEGIDVEQLYEFVMALRRGDFSARIPVPERGRERELAMHLNAHMNHMGHMVGEITRVAREVGVDGRLGPQAEVCVSGPWREMSDAVNVLAGMVTENVRDMIWTVDALNKEGRFRKVHENCEGEWKTLKSGINALVERLKTPDRLPGDRTA